MAEDNQKQILKTAGEMFFRLGVRSVSIDDICHELGMSKKTFYVYFASKEELIDRMLQQNIDYIREKMEELVQLGDFRELVRKFLKHQEAERLDVRRVPQLVYDLKKYYPRQFQDFQLRCFEVQKQYIGSYLQQGVSAGFVRANLNIDYTAFLFAKIHSDTIRDLELLEAQNINVRHMGSTAMDIFVRGILSEEGLKLYNEKAGN